MVDRKNNLGIWLTGYRNEKGKYLHTRSGSLWSSMQARCSGDESFLEHHPTYAGSENRFSSFQSFCEWAITQPGYLNKDNDGYSWQLDKDLYSLGNKVYSVDTCCFVPRSVNSLLTLCKSSRGELPLGVISSKGKFRSFISENAKRFALGTFACPIEAHRAWQIRKAAAIRSAIKNLDSCHVKAILGLDMHASLIESDIREFRETVR